MILTNTKEYTKDTKGNIKRHQNKGDLYFDSEIVVGSWLIQKGGSKAKPAKEGVAQRASGSRVERSTRVLEVDEEEDAEYCEEKEEEEADEQDEKELVVDEGR